MSKYLKQHEARKQMVLDLLKETQNYELQFGEERKAKNFEDLYKSIQEGTFSIVVVGEFSAGKSTFLNALMGEKILPSFTNETTATVNFLRSKKSAPDGAEGIAYYTDGTHTTLETADNATIEKYVSTKSDLDVAQRVESLELFLDSKFLDEGVTLVDSPGLNGVAEGHKEITENQIEKSHASIFMFSAEQPGKKTDFEFLGRLKEKVSTIFLVLNKIDCIKMSEGQTVNDVVESLINSYKSIFPDETQMPKIWPVAAYPALVARSNKILDYQGRMEFTDEDKAYYEEKSQLGEFEERLWKFLTQGEKAKEELLAPVQRVIAIIKEEQEALKQEKELLDKEDDKEQLNEQIAALEKEETEINEKMDKATRGISRQVKTIERDTLEYMKAQVQQYMEKRLSELNNVDEVDEMEMILDGFSAKFNKQLMNITSYADTKFREEMGNLIEEKFEDYVEELEGRLENSGLDIKVKSQFNIEGKNFNINIQQYEEEIRNLESKLEGLDDNIDETDLKKAQAENIENTKVQYEREIKNLRDRLHNYEQNFMPNSIETRSKQVIEKRGRDGLLGVVTTLLVGKREVVVNKEESDDTLYRESMKQKESRTNTLNREINEAQQKLSKLEGNAVSVQEIELTHKNLQRQRNNIEQAIAEKREQLKVDLANKEKSELRRLRRELDEYMDEMAGIFLAEAAKEIKNKREEYTSAVKDTVTVKLQATLEEKKKSIETLKSKLDASLEEKEKMKHQIEEKVKASETLMKKAIDIDCELSTMEIDEIEQMSV